MWICYQNKPDSFFFFMEFCVLDNCVTYWPSTEPPIKRCTCVNKQKNSETGASGQRYWNITLTCGRGWIRWWWQMCMPTGSRWTSDNYITRCHRWLGSVSSSSSCSWSQLGTRCQSESQWQTEGFGPSVTHGWAAQPECERCAAMVRRTWGSICSSLSLSPTHLSHTRNITLSRIKCERYIFIKKRVCLFIEVVHYCWLCFHIYSCICIMSIQQLLTLQVGLFSLWQVLFSILWIDICSVQKILLYGLTNALVY